MTASADNITWHEHSVSNEERSSLNGHGRALIWFTGLSGAGKSTIANAVDFKLHQRRVHSYLLDGDNVRHGLNSNLGFSEPDRIENIRRIGEVGKLLVDAGLIVCSAFISPYRRDRESIRDLLPAGQFIEVFVKASLETCELRDPKGLYKKARAGEIVNFTGIDAPYEIPDKPEIVLDSDLFNVEQLAEEVLRFLSARGLLATE
ncbi:MAG: adenylyl-sulfate kinase [Proteobacteria bacterium]|nr:adenylyl-sulfate kinase [Pseudomonadota bacterium]